MAKPSDAGAGCLGMLALGAFVLAWAKISLWAALAVAVASFFLIGYLGARAKKARRSALAARFGVTIADAILAEKVWQGATYEMMREAHGDPVEVRQKVLKSRTRETHCYGQTGKNRFKLRVHFEDGVVVGWDI
jgi:hypothetical protein